MKRTQNFLAAVILAIFLGGCARAPVAQPVSQDGPSRPKTHAAALPGQLAKANLPIDDLVRSDVPGTLGPTLPHHKLKQIAQAPDSKDPKDDKKPKKHRNGDPEEPVKRKYDDLLKDPSTLHFHPSENYFNNVYYHAREAFVDPVDPGQLISGIKKEVGNLLEQAKVSPDKLSQIDDHSKVEDVLPKLISLYGEQVDKDLLTYVAILGMLDGLKDQYSVIMTPDEYRKLKEQMQAEGFGGIGIYIELDKDHGNALTVYDPIDGTPAAKAGLEAGDHIVKIDGKSTDAITLDKAQTQIRGPVGTPVVLTIDRKGDIKDYSVVRANIKVVSVTQKMFPNNIGYVRLRMFGQDTAEEVDQALANIKAQGARAIILDLRNNGGGYIDAAVNVVGEFTAPGSLVVYTLDRNQRRREYKSTTLAQLKVPMVCLINEYSASASEITAGALRDHKVATLVGDRSFGKGSVQQLYPFDDQSALKLTIAHFYSPSGSIINLKGIEPNVEIDMEPRFVGKAEQDVQLKKALEILNDKLAKTASHN